MGTKDQSWFQKKHFDHLLHFSKEVDEDVLSCRVPSMILQPLVENAVNHGIRNIDWEGHIWLKVERDPEGICIRVRDNGKGMTQERIREILSGQGTVSEEEDNGIDSTGIGLRNVGTRLSLYYEAEGLMEIVSEGENKGTEVVLRIPDKAEEY